LEQSGQAVPPKALFPERSSQDTEYGVVRVFFGTDRERVNVPAKQAEFDSTHAKTITYGSVDVSIPRDHVIGHLESPSILRFEFNPDPSRDVAVLNVNVSGYDQFRSEMRAKALNAPIPSVLLFIHGYNVSFYDAARRTAQMAYDLDFQGAPVFFSWPSHGEAMAYAADGQALERAQDDLEQFVSQVLLASPGANIYVIAHSMGNRGMTAALIDFARNHPEDASRIKEIVLAAPDIDTDVFINQIGPKLVKIGAPITLYVSSRDIALKLSEYFNDGPRAGDCGKDMVLLDGIETVDASSVDTDFLGHSYIGDRRSVLSDLYYVLRDGKRASDRFGLSANWRHGREYWVFNR
jgi:esterase/lipase superfamily enzyme